MPQRQSRGSRKAGGTGAYEGAAEPADSWTQQAKIGHFRRYVSDYRRKCIEEGDRDKADLAHQVYEVLEQCEHVIGEHDRRVNPKQDHIEQSQVNSCRRINEKVRTCEKRAKQLKRHGGQELAASNGGPRSHSARDGASAAAPTSNVPTPVRSDPLKRAPDSYPPELQHHVPHQHSSAARVLDINQAPRGVRHEERHGGRRKLIHEAHQSLKHARAATPADQRRRTTSATPMHGKYHQPSQHDAADTPAARHDAGYAANAPETALSSPPRPRQTNQLHYHTTRADGDEEDGYYGDFERAQSLQPVEAESPVETVASEAPSEELRQLVIQLDQQILARMDRQQLRAKTREAREQLKAMDPARVYAMKKRELSSRTQEQFNNILRVVQTLDVRNPTAPRMVDHPHPARSHRSEPRQAQPTPRVSTPAHNTVEQQADQRYSYSSLLGLMRPVLREVDSETLARNSIMELESAERRLIEKDLFNSLAHPRFSSSDRTRDTLRGLGYYHPFHEPWLPYGLHRQPYPPPPALDAEAARSLLATESYCREQVADAAGDERRLLLKAYENGRPRRSRSPSSEMVEASFSRDQAMQVALPHRFLADEADRIEAVRAIERKGQDALRHFDTERVELSKMLLQGQEVIKSLERKFHEAEEHCRREQELYDRERKEAESWRREQEGIWRSLEKERMETELQRKREQELLQRNQAEASEWHRRGEETLRALERGLADAEQRRRLDQEALERERAEVEDIRRRGQHMLEKEQSEVEEFRRREKEYIRYTLERERAELEELRKKEQQLLEREREEAAAMRKRDQESLKYNLELEVEEQRRRAQEAIKALEQQRQEIEEQRKRDKDFLECLERERREAEEQRRRDQEYMRARERDLWELRSRVEASTMMLREEQERTRALETQLQLSRSEHRDRVPTLPIPPTETQQGRHAPATARHQPREPETTCPRSPTSDATPSVSSIHSAQDNTAETSEHKAREEQRRLELEEQELRRRLDHRRGQLEEQEHQSRLDHERAERASREGILRKEHTELSAIHNRQLQEEAAKLEAQRQELVQQHLQAREQAKQRVEEAERWTREEEELREDSERSRLQTLRDRSAAVINRKWEQRANLEEEESQRRGEQEEEEATDRRSVRAREELARRKVSEDAERREEAMRERVVEDEERRRKGQEIDEEANWADIIRKEEAERVAAVEMIRLREEAEQRAQWDREQAEGLAQRVASLQDDERRGREEKAAEEEKARGELEDQEESSRGEAVRNFERREADEMARLRAHELQERLAGLEQEEETERKGEELLETEEREDIMTEQEQEEEECRVRALQRLECQVETSLAALHREEEEAFRAITDMLESEADDLSRAEREKERERREQEVMLRGVQEEKARDEVIMEETRDREEIEGEEYSCHVEQLSANQESLRNAEEQERERQLEVVEEQPDLGGTEEPRDEEEVADMVCDSLLDAVLQEAVKDVFSVLRSRSPDIAEREEEGSLTPSSHRSPYSSSLSSVSYRESQGVRRSLSAELDSYESNIPSEPQPLSPPQEDVQEASLKSDEAQHEEPSTMIASVPPSESDEDSIVQLKEPSREVSRAGHGGATREDQLIENLEIPHADSVYMPSRMTSPAAATLTGIPVTESINVHPRKEETIPEKPNAVPTDQQRTPELLEQIRDIEMDESQIRGNIHMEQREQFEEMKCLIMNLAKLGFTEESESERRRWLVMEYTEACEKLCLSAAASKAEAANKHQEREAAEEALRREEEAKTQHQKEDATVKAKKKKQPKEAIPDEGPDDEEGVVADALLDDMWQETWTWVKKTIPNYRERCEKLDGCKGGESGKEKKKKKKDEKDDKPKKKEKDEGKDDKPKKKEKDEGKDEKPKKKEKGKNKGKDKEKGKDKDKDKPKKKSSKGKTKEAVAGSTNQQEADMLAATLRFVKHLYGVAEGLSDEESIPETALEQDIFAGDKQYPHMILDVVNEIRRRYYVRKLQEPHPSVAKYLVPHDTSYFPTWQEEVEHVITKRFNYKEHAVNKEAMQCMLQEFCDTWLDFRLSQQRVAFEIADNLVSELCMDTAGWLASIP